MPRRQILITAAQITALAIAATVVLAIILIRSSGDNGLPGPPREGTFVVEGEAGWFMALPDRPFDPRGAARIWVQSKELEKSGQHDGDQLYVWFRPVTDDSGSHVATVYDSLPLPEGSWYIAIVSIPPLDNGDYNIVLTRGSEQLAHATVNLTYEEVRGIKVQRWHAEDAARRADMVASAYGTSSCLAEGYDESSALWDVTCYREDAKTTAWAVDAQSGEINQTAGPAPVELKGPLRHGF